MPRIYRQFPVINPEWDNDEDLSILRNEAEHDWDDDNQNDAFHILSRWGDIPDSKGYNKKEFKDMHGGSAAPPRIV